MWTLHRLKISTANCKIMWLSNFSNWACLSASSCAFIAWNSKCSASATSFIAASIWGFSSGTKEEEVLGMSCGFVLVDPSELVVCIGFEASINGLGPLRISKWHQNGQGGSCSGFLPAFASFFFPFTELNKQNYRYLSRLLHLVWGNSNIFEKLVTCSTRLWRTRSPSWSSNSSL